MAQSTIKAFQIDTGTNAGQIPVLNSSGELDLSVADLADSAYTNATAAGQLLIWNATGGQFENVTLSNGGNVTINNGDASISLSVPNDLTVMSNYTTDDLAEGTGNLYFTDERAQDAINNLLVSSNAITLSYDDTGNALTIGESHSSVTTNPHNVTATQVGAIASIDGVANAGGDVDLVNGGNVTITPDDTNNEITLSVPNDLTVMSNYTTDDLAEGTGNLYFTDERAQDAIGTAITNGTQTGGITVTHDDANNALNYSIDDTLYVSTSGDTMGGDLNMGGFNITNWAYSEGTAQSGTGGETITIDYTTGNWHQITANGNLTIALSNMPAGVSTLIIEAIDFGSYTITWPTGILWDSGTAPTFTSTGTDLVKLYQDSGGTLVGILLASNIS